MDQLTTRAISAYYKAAQHGDVLDQPANDSGVTKHKGKQYVVLHNVNDVLAVYRVRNDGILRRMKRWPEALNKW